ncbi:transcriptional regulator, XRE family [Rippkaea orientalis PCC 8801]|uniref:Transcriptional regulator, XRE family n=1 Tax=Rippkaea orientalis (strain PCC 8801 / RF-1) TaxID=41431 RepID=B7K690_RIPO1|nr:helix-turn-helix transcriptional regulator [Rippkaea orientalis]ACK68143.1 transcriptional regulator, XRE family [Rippkaea orientalis PCC 8801]
MDANILIELGNFLHKIRTRKGLSQEYLAELADLDRTYISLLERGKRNPSLTCINSIFQALDIDIIEIFQLFDYTNKINQLSQFCQSYDLEFEYLAEVLNDPKVIPMIRGKSFEFTVKKYISQILSPQKYEITNPRLNAQTGVKDVDVMIINKESNQTYTVECKLAAKGSFRTNPKANPYLKVKCMRSRTLGQEAAQQRANSTGLSHELWSIHSDQYRQEDFDFVVTSIANVFYETTDDGLYQWKPDQEAELFLSKLGITNQQQAFQTMLIARSRELVSNQPNRILYNVNCTRLKCKNPNCGFIPNYPFIYFNIDTGKPLAPWIYLDQLETLLI